MGDRGDDVLIGGAGGDVLDGGDGTDRVSYITSTAGVKACLDGSYGSGGDAQDDVLIAVENLTGSDFADTLSGGTGVNVLAGGDGDDVLEGLGGADRLDGGSGSDTAFYGHSPEPVTVSL